MKDNFDEIDQRVISAVGLASALESIRLLLEEEIGSAFLLVRLARPAASHLREKAVAKFLESRDFPFRASYTSKFDTGGQEAVLIACFGSWGSPGQLLERATAQAARALGALQARMLGEPGFCSEAA